MGEAECALIRIVLDTNVLISAILFEGQSSRLVFAWQTRQIGLLVSKQLLSEYIRVLHYPKFRLIIPEIQSIIEQDILPFITPVKVSRAPRIIQQDPFDNHILACAAAGKASLIVSGDKHLLTLGSYKKIPIVTVSELLKDLDG